MFPLKSKKKKGQDWISEHLKIQFEVIIWGHIYLCLGDSRFEQM